MGDPANGRALIRFLPLPDTEYTYYIKSDLIEAVTISRLFSKVEYVEMSGPDKSSPFGNLGIIGKSDDEIFNMAFASIPNELPKDTDCAIDFVVLLKGADTDFFGQFWKLFTLLIVPAKRHFSYEVAIRLVTNSRPEPTITKLSEDFKYELSSIPTNGAKAQITWVKEPVVNLMKIALKQFHDQGILR